MILSAIIHNGSPIFDYSDEQALQAYLRSKEGKKVWYAITETKPPRSLQQNAYYWSTVVQLIADYTGDDPESTHKYLKNRFCQRFFNEKGNPVEKSTTRLTTSEFTQYIDRCIAFAAEHGIVIPSPDNAT